MRNMTTAKTIKHKSADYMADLETVCSLRSWFVSRTVQFELIKLPRVESIAAFVMGMAEIDRHSHFEDGLTSK